MIEEVAKARNVIKRSQKIANASTTSVMFDAGMLCYMAEVIASIYVQGAESKSNRLRHYEKASEFRVLVFADLTAFSTETLGQRFAAMLGLNVESMGILKAYKETKFSSSVELIKRYDLSSGKDLSVIGAGPKRSGQPSGPVKIEISHDQYQLALKRKQNGGCFNYNVKSFCQRSSKCPHEHSCAKCKQKGHPIYKCTQK